MRTLLTVIGLVSAVWSAGCSASLETVAPPPAPRAEWPRGVDALPSPPAPGFTRVTLDANGERARVIEVLDARSSTGSGWGAYGQVTVSTYTENTRPVCITPCQVDLQPGLHALRFTAVEGGGAAGVDVQIGGTPKAVRVALGHSHFEAPVQSAGAALQVLGFTTAVVGGCLWAASSLRNSDSHTAGLRPAGVGLTVGGLAGFGLGVPLAFVAPPKFQPGSTTEVPASAR